jgi:hypothetical protein
MEHTPMEHTPMTRIHVYRTVSSPGQGEIHRSEFDVALVVKRCNASLAIVAIVNIPRSEVLEDARGSGISPGTACGRSLVRCIQN